MRLDLTPIFVGVAAVLGLIAGLADVLLQNHRAAAARRLSGLLLCAIVMGGLGVVGSIFVLLGVGLVVGGVAASMLLPCMLHVFGLRAWQRALLLLGGMGVCVVWARQDPSRSGDLSALAALLLPWGLLTGLAKDASRVDVPLLRPVRVAKAPPLSTHRLPPRTAQRAAPVTKVTEQMSAAAQALVEPVRRQRRGLRPIGPVGQGVLGFLGCYLIGAAIIALSLAPLDGVLLALAGALSFGSEPAPFGADAGLAYWVSFGILPSAGGGLVSGLLARGRRHALSAD